MFALKIKQAETAISDGRLEEACQLLSQPEVRAHRRGQALIAEVIRRLQQRIEQHLVQRQFEAALEDCHRALTLGGNQPDLERLRSQAAEQLARRERQQAQQLELLQMAQQRLAQGELSLGQQWCGQLPEDASRRADLSAQIQRQREEAEAASARAQQAWARQAVQDTVEALRKAQQWAPHHRMLQALKGQVLEQLCGQARDALQQGQLARAQSLVALGCSLDPQQLQVVDTVGLLQRAQQAAQQIDRADFAAAWESLRVLGQMLPEATWIPQALDWAQQAQQARQALRGCPLFSFTSPADPTQGLPPPAATRHLGSRPAAAGSLPSRLLVQVDGAGRFLVLRQSSVRLGSRRDSAMTAVDIDWSGGDPLEPVVLERIEDDYFLRGTGSVRVNGQAVTSALLADGDRLLIGSRGAVKFLLPCAASRSAVLRFSGLRLHPPDARGVILMDDAIVIAPTSQAHIQVRELQRGFVLFLRQERLYIRDLEGGADPGTAQEVQICQPLSLGSANLVVLPAED